jgi:hypothetical protein
MRMPPIRRVVTGHDENGRSVVVSEGPLPTVVEIEAVPGTMLHEVWTTTGSPARIDNGIDPTLNSVDLLPPNSGNHVLFVDFPPETPEFLVHGLDAAKEAFAQIGDIAASTARSSSPHPLMHRTETLDYGVVIEGEITLVLDNCEVLLGPGSVVVQRGTNHAWSNRSGRLCRMLFVLLDGTYDPAIVAALART